MQNNKWKNWDNNEYYNEYTYDSLPKYIKILIFLNRGTYNGSGWKIRWKRFLCLIGKHKKGYFYSNDDYIPKPKVITGYYQCQYCGTPSNKIKIKINGQ